MTRASRFDGARAKLAAGWRNRALSLKAISFGLVGLVNTAVDYGVFLARARGVRTVAGRACGVRIGFRFLPVRQCSDHFLDRRQHGVVARRRDRLICDEFVDHLCRGIRPQARGGGPISLSSPRAWPAGSPTRRRCSSPRRSCLLPVWLAKAVAILASFVVNFSLSHFVVFRVRRIRRATRRRTFERGITLRALLLPLARLPGGEKFAHRGGGLIGVVGGGESVDAGGDGGAERQILPLPDQPLLQPHGARL